MAAPSATARQDPGGVQMVTGWPALVTFELDPDIELFEKMVTPPGIETGELTELTNQHNSIWKTYAPQGLLRLTDMSFTAGYDPSVYYSIRTVAGKNQGVTLWWPNTDSLAFYGVLRSFVPGQMQQGQPPEATVTISPTNADPDDCTEQGPVWTNGTGTANPCGG